MKKIFSIVIVLCFTIGLGFLKAQINPCGSYVTLGQTHLEKTFTIKEGKPSNSLPQVNRVISIAVFVIKEKESPYFNAGIMNGIITNLNQYFASISLSFKICGAITTIENFQFDNLIVNGNTKDLTIQYSEPNTINLYLASSVTDTAGRNVCGFSYMPVDIGKNYIFINKNCLQAKSLTEQTMALAHQLGHFFNLYHTNEIAFGEELPDGTNCTTTGDRCCDTDASPDLSITGMVNLTTCTYTGTVKRSTQLFSPSTKNIMALSPVACRCMFSRTQFLRMIYALNNFRNYLR